MDNENGCTDESSELSYLDIARINDPDGRICHFCKKRNDFADDIGFWYITPDIDNTAEPCCEACWESKPGILHRERFGVGE